MNQLLPAFDFQHVVVMPWTSGLSSYGWSMLMGFFVATACGLIGNYLILRRMALVGDAISHSVLPGMRSHFCWRKAVVRWRCFSARCGGDCHDHPHRDHPKKSRVKQDAAIGITFRACSRSG